MADGLNRWTGIGRLGGDPELRFAGNTPVLNMSLACEESWFDKASNQRKSRTEWIPCVLWGARAESLAKILGKGDLICVEGSLYTEQWNDKAGNKRSAIKVRASNVVLCGGRRGGGQQQHAPDPDMGDGAGLGDDNFDY